MEGEIIITLGINGGYDICMQMDGELVVLAHRNTRSEAEQVKLSLMPEAEMSDEEFIGEMEWRMEKAAMSRYVGGGWG